MEEVRITIIKELQERAELLKEASCDNKDRNLLYEHVGFLKAIEVVKNVNLDKINK